MKEIVRSKTTSAAITERLYIQIQQQSKQLGLSPSTLVYKILAAHFTDDEE